jgi:adenylate cyclase
MSDPFTPSPELAAITRRWLTTYAARHSAGPVALFSRSDAVTFLGSDDGELLTGEDLRRTFAAFTDRQAPLDLEDIEVTAYEAGAFGWALAVFMIHAPQAGLRVRCRSTFVFSLEDAVWRVVHVHNSNSRPNLETMGYSSPSLDEMAAEARRERLDLGQTGIASVMFTDIADSTALAAAVGDAAWNRLVRDHIARLTGLIEAAGGRLVKSLGDGTLSTYPSASAAMQAACAIQAAMEAAATEPHLSLRIGIHTGDVVQSEGDFLGTVVNKAARIAATAQPGEIRVSDATRVMIGPGAGLTFADPQQVLLRGLDGEHLIHRLDWRP